MSNHNHKKFTGRLTKEELAEIFILTQTEVLVEGLALHNGHFVRLVYADDKQKDAAVKCTHCQRFFGNFPENYNTIRFHMKNCKGTDDPIIVPRHFKEALLKELAHLCAADGLSFSQATGPGLTNTFDFIYKQGYLHGRNIAINNIVSSAVPSIKDSVPDRRAVSTFVKDFVDANKPDFDEFVVKNIRSYGGACAIDLTTKSGVHFMGITVHFLSEKWEHHAYLLDIREYDENKSDAVALAGFIKNVLLSHGLTNDDIKKIIFAIDEGSNLNAALHDHMTVNCSCHICHLVGYHAVEPYSEGYLPNDPDIHVDPDTREKLAAVRETLDFTKKIIKGVK
uniref:Transposase n=1 Tax=Acrobeloides nanus TaxID=290746 RepID=A0A914DXQ0_9BILA